LLLASWLNSGKPSSSSLHCCWPAGSVQVNLLHLPYVYHDRGDSSSDIASVHFTKVFFVYSQLIAVDLLSLFVWV